MIAYYVHDEKKDNDIIVLPGIGCKVTVDRKRLETFISVKPDFASWSADDCGDLSPEDFGTIVATRDGNGDVCIRNQKLWRARMEHYLGHP